VRKKDEEVQMSANIGQRITEIIKRRGITQEELGKTSGIQPAKISKYVNGKLKPSLENLVRLAEALHASSDELLGIESRESEYEKLEKNLRDHQIKMVKKFMKMLRDENVL